MSTSDLRELLKRSLLRIEELEASLEQQAAAAAEPIAIIGIGCRFPGGGSDPQSFWASLLRGVDAVNEIPPGRWPASFPRPTQPAARWAGLLEQVDRFDAEFFRISPREAMSMDPQQRLLLEVVWEAIEDAGQLPEQLAGSRTGVFVGIMNLDYKERFVVGDPELLDLYCFLGNGLSEAPGRVSYVLGLQGPCAAVDTACSSSLVAVHLACQSLRSGESTLALAGGVHLILSPLMMEMMARTQGLSPDGRCKTFDARANGMVRAEGCGVIALKRLSDARRDGDQIRAVIRGSAVNQDGGSSGFTVPNVLSQESLLRQALASAGVSASQISYVEAHGTGTPLGDPIEMEALQRVLGQLRPDGSQCAVSSVKTNLGHLEAAAGIAGLIKTVLALEQRRIPRHLHFQTLNPRISLAESSLVIPVEEQAWLAPAGPRLAGVSSFGVSGINAHAILEEVPAEPPPPETPRDQVLTLTAKTEPALRTMAERYVQFLSAAEGEPETDTAAISYTASARRSHHGHRLAVVGKTPKEWLAALQRFTRSEPAPGLAVGRTELAQSPRVVFIFSGHGSQWFGMAQQLLASEPAFRTALLACDAAIQKESGLSVVSELTGDQGRLWASRVDIIQPVLFSLQLALAAQWRSWGVVPAAVVGTSMGEVAAAQVGGALSLQEAVRIICRRSQLIQKMMGRGAMIVAELSLAQAQQLTEEHAGRLSVAASNGPRSTVLSGEPQIIEEVLARLERNGTFCRRLQGGSAASHSHQMDALREELLASLGELQPRDPAVTMFSTVTAQTVSAGMLDAGYWFRNMREPVMLWPTLAALAAQKYNLFVEVSPHPILLPALQDGIVQLGGGIVTLGTLRRGQPDLRCMLDTLAELYVRGQDVDWNQLHGAARKCVSLPTYPWQRERYWVEGQPFERSRSAGRAAGAASAIQHPLLGAPFSVSTQPAARFWEQRLTVHQTPWIKEHRIRGRAVFPGAGYLEMALSAASQVTAGSAIVLEDMRFERMLQLDEQSDCTLQTVLVMEGADTGSIQVSHLDEQRWLRHATGRVRSAEATAPARLPAEQLEAIKARCSTHRSKQEHYQRIANNGGQYGPQFQAVEELWLGPGEVLGRVRLPELAAELAPRYRLHPVWIDACLQVTLASAQLASGELWVPIGLERLRLDAVPSSQAWVHVQERTEPGAPGGLVRSLRVFTADGHGLLQVHGLRLARLDEESEVGRSAAAELFYEVKWRLQALPPRPAPRAAPAGPWLILRDRAGLGRRLQAALQRRGQDCIGVEYGQHYERLTPIEYRMNPTEPQSYRELLRDSLGITGACQGIIHGFSLNMTPATQLSADDLEQDQRFGYLSALSLVQALAQTGWRDMPPLWLLTQDLAALEGDTGVLGISQAPLWGLGKVLTVEQPELSCRLVDLDDSAAPGREQELVDELLATSREPAVALRHGRRYVARLTRTNLSAATPAAHPSVRSTGSYLITGGLGGLGLAAAQWLVAAGARSLLLLGRSEPAESARDLIERMRLDGVEVVTAQVDIASAQQLAPILAELGQRLPPLYGIVHAAGVLDDALLAEQTAERFERVMAAKVRGAWNLHVMTQHQPLDFFFCYSSAMSMLGSPGQANYVAANAFLDAFAHYRQRLGQPATSINWGLFTEVGLATVNTKVAGRLAERGMQSLTMEQARQVFMQLLSQPRAQLGVMNLDGRKWVEYYPYLAGSPFWNELSLDEPSTKAAIAEAPFRAQLRQAKPAERAAVLQGLIAQQVGYILRMDAERIDRQTPFRQLGVDSLMSLEIRNLLERSIGEKLPAVLLLTYPTIESLGIYLLEKLGLLEQAPEAQATATLADSRPEPANLSQMNEDELLARLAQELVLAKKGGHS